MRSIVYNAICRVMSLLLLGVPFYAHAIDESEPPSRAEYVFAKVAEGDAVCAKVPLIATVENVVDKKGLSVKRITERPVALCAYSEKTKTWHVVEVRVQYPVPEVYITCVKNAPTIDDRKSCMLPFRVVTPGYQVTHLRGYGIVRMIFDVFAEDVTSIKHGDETRELRTRGEKLTVYRTRHMWLDDDALASGDADRIVATATAKNYTPYHPDFYDEGLVYVGEQFLFDKVRSAQRELGIDVSAQKSVRSHAFPELALGAVIPWETPVALAVIEQMDDKTFQSDKKLATEAVFIEYALNREGAFRYSQSGAYAIGPLQFTDGGGNGTYSAMVREYPGANIDPNFQSGARDIGNVLKAAIALIDHEVAHFPVIMPIFTKNPKVGGAFPVAAYNGGPASARALYVWLKKRGWSIERKEIVLPTSFAMKRTEKCPCKNVPVAKGKKKRIVDHIVVPVQNSETPGYIVKYFYLLNYLADKEFE